MSTDLTLSKAHISKTIQSGGFLGSLLSKLVVVPLAKNIFSSLRSNSSFFNNWCRNSKKKMHGSGRPSTSAPRTVTLIILNKELNDIMKIVQALEDSNILLKEATKTVKNETKEQKGGFWSMLLGTLGASLLRNILAGKAIVRAGFGNKKGKEL